MFQIFPKKAAESLIEVIIAVFVVSLGSSVATSLVVTSIQSNSFSRDNLIALNLATEGLEAMRNIRDNNWLRFSFDKGKCWNISPETTDCSTGKIISSGNYTVSLDEGYAWILKKIGDGKTLNLDTMSGNDDFKLQLEERDKQNVYVQVSSSGLKVTPTNFYRMVTVSYSYPGIDKMDTTSTIQWLFQGKKHEIRLNETLTNYQKVKDI